VRTTLWWRRIKFLWWWELVVHKLEFRDGGTEYQFEIVKRGAVPKFLYRVKK